MEIIVLTAALFSGERIQETYQVSAKLLGMYTPYINIYIFPNLKACVLLYILSMQNNICIHRDTF